MISRRMALACLGSAAAAASGAAHADERPGAAPYADPIAADEWMQRWIENVKKGYAPGAKLPVGDLRLGRFADRIYFLTSEIGWQSASGSRVYAPVRVPIGFVTDFASIPRPFWSALPPDGLYAYAAVIHDYLYWDQSRPRAEADEILKLCMEDFRVDVVTVDTIYTGVRLGGGPAWNDNARRKQSGEKRILKRFPTDPTVRWSEWKDRPDVY
jgi:hypothetical protein